MVIIIEKGEKISPREQRFVSNLLFAGHLVVDMNIPDAEAESEMAAAAEMFLEEVSKLF